MKPTEENDNSQITEFFEDNFRKFGVKDTL